MIDSFLNAIRNLFNVPELRKRVMFTLGMLVIYRTGIHIQVPGVDKEALEQLWGSLGGNLFGVMDLFSGGNLRRISIFALGIMPYITASIILQFFLFLCSPGAPSAPPPSPPACRLALFFSCSPRCVVGESFLYSLYWYH